jgi:DNA polymerase III delta prime subunit
MSSLWTVKYAPKRLADLFPRDIVKILQSAVELQRQGKPQEVSLPHYMFYGPSGSGKTAIIDAFLNDFYGTDTDQILRFNSADDRGIQVVRDTITQYSNFGFNPKYPFKTIVIDDFDSITPDAQVALRRVMELTPNIRYIMACIKLSSVDPALLSRTMGIHCREFSAEQKLDFIRKVWAAERREGSVPPECGELKLKQALLQAQFGFVNMPSDETLTALASTGDWRDIYNLIMQIRAPLPEIVYKIYKYLRKHRPASLELPMMLNRVLRASYCSHVPELQVRVLAMLIVK